MEGVVKNIRDLDESDRSALEHIVGQPLRETQQVVVNVIELDLSAEIDAGNVASTSVPPWGNIYDGLSEEEVDRLDAAIRRRADLSRVFE